MTKLEELRAKRAEIDAEIAALESLPQYPEGWDRMPMPGEILFTIMRGRPYIDRLERYPSNRHGMGFQVSSGTEWSHAIPIDWSTVPRETWPKLGIEVERSEEGSHFFLDGNLIEAYTIRTLLGRELAPGEKVVI